MSPAHWTDPDFVPPQSGPTDDERRRRNSMLGSVGAHLLIVALVFINQQFGPPLEPPKPVEPDFPIVFDEPKPPPAPLLMPRTVPPPAPRSAAPPPTPGTQDQSALQQPQPAAPPPPDDASLLGWKTHGDKPGEAVRPPGPETGKLGPGAPGPDGKGMRGAQDGGDRGGEAPQAPPAGRVGDGSDQLPRDMRDQNRAADDPFRYTPPRPNDGLPADRSSGGLPSFRVPPGSARSGRPGNPGSGTDYNLGMNGGFFGDLSFESGDYNWSDYSTKVYFAILRSWLRELDGRIPRFERDQNLRSLPNLDGYCTIRFVLHRDGTVSGLEVLQPSPMPALDDASAAAIRRAVLPPLPEDFPRNQERPSFRFKLEGFETAQQLARQLDQSRYRGDF